MFAVTAYTVKELRDRATRMNILGRSAMNKDDLYREITDRLDVCHGLALEIEQQRNRENLAEIYVAPFSISDFLKPGQDRLPRKIKKSLRKAGMI